jgi:hypothetical protein
MLTFERRLRPANGPSSADPVRRIVVLDCLAHASVRQSVGSWYREKIVDVIHVPAPIFIASTNCRVDSAEKSGQRLTFVLSTHCFSVARQDSDVAFTALPDELLWWADASLPSWHNRSPHRRKSWDKSVICSS